MTVLTLSIAGVAWSICCVGSEAHNASGAWGSRGGTTTGHSSADTSCSARCWSTAVTCAVCGSAGSWR